MRTSWNPPDGRISRMKDTRMVKDRPSVEVDKSHGSGRRGTR
nr:MAG TPA: hypothetical protein [Caudoviricetes sp.]